MIRIRAELLLKYINFASLLKITLSEKDHRPHSSQLKNKEAAGRETQRFYHGEQLKQLKGKFGSETGKGTASPDKPSKLAHVDFPPSEFPVSINSEECS